MSPPPGSEESAAAAAAGGGGGSVAGWYAGRCVLVTGGAGFMGKVLLEKLLRACPGVERIYLLLRPKRGSPAARRLHEMLQLPLFERLRRERPEALAKLVPVAGDLLAPGLALAAADRARLAADVSVLFHGAATVRMDLGLADCLEQNVRGTQRVLELALDLPRLEALLHLSTAFCHCEEQLLLERVYPAPAAPDDALRVLQLLDDESLRLVTPQLLGPHPNCYTYSKRLAEALVAEQRPRLPVLIVRPSIVTPALREPLPGWVDNLNGPVGLWVAAGKGVLRTVLCNPNYGAEVVPVDVAANAQIAAAWDAAAHRRDEKETPVYNASVGEEVGASWGDVLERGRRLIVQCPFEGTVWYPDGAMRTNPMMNSLYVFFLHVLPAYFIDFLMLLLLQKRFMVRLQQRIAKGMQLLQYFTMRRWQFPGAALRAAAARMRPEERRVFYTGGLDLDPDAYLAACILGARQYCMKEPLSSLPRARLRLHLLYALDVAFRTALLGGLLWLLLRWVEPLRLFLDTATGVLLGPFGATPGAAAA